MTRKDYVAIAAAVSSTIERAPKFVHTPETIAAYQRGAAALALELAHICGMDNPRFDGARFLKACGVQS